jgi:1,4-dihydroxy-2-naphthoate octaprenyltransferase
MIVVGVYVALTGKFSWEPLLISMIPGVFTMGVVLVSNTFDYFDDIKSGKKTFAVRFGQAAEVKLMTVSSVIAYVAVIGGVIAGLVPVWALLVLLTVPMAYDAVKYTFGFANADRYKAAMTKAITLSSVACILLLAAYGIVILF